MFLMFMADDKIAGSGRIYGKRYNAIPTLAEGRDSAQTEYYIVRWLFYVQLIEPTSHKMPPLDNNSMAIDKRWIFRLYMLN